MKILILKTNLLSVFLFLFCFCFVCVCLFVFLFLVFHSSPSSLFLRPPLLPQLPQPLHHRLGVISNPLRTFEPPKFSEGVKESFCLMPVLKGGVLEDTDARVLAVQRRGAIRCATSRSVGIIISIASHFGIIGPLSH